MPQDQYLNLKDTRDDCVLYGDDGCLDSGVLGGDDFRAVVADDLSDDNGIFLNEISLPHDVGY